MALGEGGAGAWWSSDSEGRGTCWDAEVRNSLGVNKEEEDVPPALFLRREGGCGASSCDDEGRPVGIMDSLEERRKD
eukprot:scaffold934_cov191-Alexandrium_tamarense.AAC.21